MAFTYDWSVPENFEKSKRLCSQLVPSCKQKEHRHLGLQGSWTLGSSSGCSATFNVSIGCCGSCAAGVEMTEINQVCIFLPKAYRQVHLIQYSHKLLDLHIDSRSCIFHSNPGSLTLATLLTPLMVLPASPIKQMDHGVREKHPHKSKWTPSEAANLHTR